MLKQRNEQIQLLIRVGDVILCILAFFGAYWIQTLPYRPFGAAGAAFSTMSWTLGASVVIHFFLYPVLGFYESIRRKSVFKILSMISKSLLIEILILGSLIFFLQAKETSRYYFGLFIGLNYFLILSQRLGARFLLTVIRKRGFNFRQVLIVGTGSNAVKIIEAFKKNPHWGYVLMGALKTPGENEIHPELDLPVLGALSEMEKIIRERTVDEVYFALEQISADEIQKDVSLCETFGVAVHFPLALFELPASKISIHTVEDIPVVTFYTTQLTPIGAFLKRALDLLLSIIGLLITACLYPWIAFMIRRQSPDGPVIFKQIRIGENGRRFKCYKFRTMLPDAEERKEALSRDNLMTGPLFKVKEDPRVFPFGAFLRKTSLDELPQFLNIFRGDMSMVGTRPPTPDEVEKYENHYHRRLSIRPGLTGLWQVSGRNKIRNFDEVLALDLKYIDEWSLWLDLWIILKTVYVTCFKRGAY